MLFIRAGSWYFEFLTRYALDAGEGWSLTLPLYFPFTAPRVDGERRILWIERRRELPRAGLFVLALALALVNGFVLTGAIVSTVYSYRVARFAAREVLTGRQPFSRRIEATHGEPESRRQKAAHGAPRERIAAARARPGAVARRSGTRRQA